MCARPPRLKTFTYQGFHRYFLTFCTNNRRSIFTERALVEEVLTQIRTFAGQHEFSILAYCFMPDHLHLLLEGRSDSADLKQFAEAAKRRVGYWYYRECRQRLWQPGYYDRVLRNEESTPAVVRYILENPIRAGLALSIDAYPFSGSAFGSVADVATTLP